MTDQIAFGLTIGIVSGLVTTALIWVITVVWSRGLVPWYEKRVYKGIQIHGNWVLEVADDVDDPWAHSETLTLVQTAHRISGIATLTLRKKSNNFPTSLTVIGEISDRIVSLMLQSPLRDRLSYSVLLLEVVGNGTRLSGEVSFYDTESSCIQSAAVTYKKDI